MLKFVSDMLRGLFQANTRSHGDRTADVAARLEQKVLKLVGNMPTLPDVATRAMALANDPNANAADFARLIEGDAAIATDLLRVANSAVYGGTNPAVKLSQAVVHLGMLPCKNLVVSISMKSLMWKMVGAQKMQCEALWHHGFVTGCLCRQINRSFRLMFGGEEFSAGLLHDMGRVLLLLADPECFNRINGMDFDEQPGLLEREQAAIGIDHCALGGWFGEHSKLPDILIQTMKLHHDEYLSQDDNRLVALVATADHMANHLQRGEDPETYSAEQNFGLAALWARWPEAKKERFLAEIPSLMNESVQAAASLQSGR